MESYWHPRRHLNTLDKNRTFICEHLYPMFPWFVRRWNGRKSVSASATIEEDEDEDENEETRRSEDRGSYLRSAVILGPRLFMVASTCLEARSVVACGLFRVFSRRSILKGHARGNVDENVFVEERSFFPSFSPFFFLFFFFLVCFNGD